MTMGVLFCLALQMAAPAAASWLDGWMSAMQHAATARVHVVVMSDSTARVDQSNGIGVGPEERANLWPQRLRVDLDPDHGSGLLTLEGNAARFDNDVWSIPAPYAYTPAIGPWEAGMDHGQVPPNGGTVLLHAGETAKLAPQKGDTLWLYWAACPDSRSPSVSVDGQPQVIPGSETAAAPCTARRSRVYSGPAGVHTAAVTASSGNAYVYAAEWTTGESGVSVDNLAIGGATAGFFAGETKLAFVRAIPDVALLIVSLGINDFIHGVPPDEYGSNLTAIVTGVRKSFPETSVLIVNQYRVFSDERRNALGLPQSDYAAVARRVAQEQRVGFLDVAAAWGSFAEETTRGWLTRDSVHPSDAGGRAFACAVERVIAPARTASCTAH
jgi:lysophospholipase L1-like esterase